MGNTQGSVTEVKDGGTNAETRRCALRNTGGRRRRLLGGGGTTCITISDSTDIVDPKGLIFQGGAKGTIYAPWKNILMLYCLVWKIQSPHFHVYGLLRSEKSSDLEKSKAPIQRPDIFRMALRRQSSRPVKI